MTAREPPVVATWLLKHLCYGLRTDAVLGDLQERFAAGQGVAWYWRQALHAVALGPWRFVISQWPRLLVAIVASWAVMLTWLALNNVIIERLPGYLGRHSHPYSRDSGFWIALFVMQGLFRFLMFAMSGVVLIRLQRAHPVVASVALLATASLWRFVPWRLAPVLDPTLHTALHYLTAIVGFAAGAVVAAHFRRPPVQRLSI